MKLVCFERFMFAIFSIFIVHSSMFITACKYTMCFSMYRCFGHVTEVIDEISNSIVSSWINRKYEKVDLMIYFRNNGGINFEIIYLCL